MIATQHQDAVTNMTLTGLAGLLTGFIVGWATIKFILWLKTNWDLMNIQLTEYEQPKKDCKCQACHCTPLW